MQRNSPFYEKEIDQGKIIEILCFSDSGLGTWSRVGVFEFFFSMFSLGFKSNCIRALLLVVLKSHNAIFCTTNTKKHTTMVVL